MDVLMIDEPIPEFVNAISVEKMCKKAYGIMTAYGEVRAVSDWKRPAGNSKWTSKVNWDKAKFINPDLVQEEVLHIPGVEDEVRGVMDREAQMMKIQTKLQERSKKSNEA